MNRDKLQRIAGEISVANFIDYQLYLDTIYKAIKLESKRYSYLQFSEDLGFSKSNVIHLIIKGKRPLSVKASDKIISSLGINGNEKRYFTCLIHYHNARQTDKRDQLFQDLLDLKRKLVAAPESQSQLEFFSEWYHIIIYQMSFMENFKGDPQFIARSLTPNIRPEQARKSLQLLINLDLISQDPESGVIRPTKTQISTGDEITSIAIIRYHQKMIELGKQSITNCHETLRDVSSISISVPLDIVAELKSEISAFRKRMLAISDQYKDDCDEVYQMNIQLFPTTKLKKKDHDS